VYFANVHPFIEAKGIRAKGNQEATTINKNPLFKTAQTTQIRTHNSDHTPRTRGSKTLGIQTPRDEN
jgi:hypothetical protein